VDAFRKAFRSPLPTGKIGRPRLIAWQGIHIVQVVKQRRDGVLTIQRRIVQGTQDGVGRLLTRSRGGGVINTAYIGSWIWPFVKTRAVFEKTMPLKILR